MNDSTFTELASRMFGGSTPQAAAPVTATPTSELADLARDLFTSMDTDASDDDADDEGEGDDTPSATTLPESAWANAADVAQWEAEVNNSSLRHELPNARDFLLRHADADLLQLLNKSGAGSHPLVIKFLVKLAQKYNAGGAR